MRRFLILVGVTSVLTAATMFACSSDDSVGGPSTSDAATDTATFEAAVDAGACPPAASVDPDQIKWVPPNAPDPNACSDAQLNAVYQACYTASATPASCNAVTAASANSGCSACLFSTYGQGSSYGPIIHIDAFDTTNYEGCYGLVLGDVSATGCAAKMQIADECETLACSSCRPLSTEASNENFVDCENAATVGACAALDQANCGYEDGGVPDGGYAYQKCFGGSSFKEDYDFITRLFCGGYITDAGADAATDAGDD